uniref:C-type lectin domain-containing protein n=1 Tax=Gouania willdenowi TaxID=441366 RepID=A0A8C5E7F2_GOUWI
MLDSSYSGCLWAQVMEGPPSPAPLSRGRGPAPLCPTSYSGSQLDPEVFFVNLYKTWPVAQKYCRENYVDLVTVTNNKVVEKINSETGGLKGWIGLHRAPNFFWSDGSNFTFSNWDSVHNKLNSMKVICAVTSSTKGGKWKFLSCEEKLPFVCYSMPHG